MALLLSGLASAQITYDINENTGITGAVDDLTTIFGTATVTSIQATTVAGPITGRSCPDGLARFYGVPYSTSTAAAQPRFKMPIALTPWTTPMETTMIKHCYQSDDCHYLNVATPIAKVSDPPVSVLDPVLVYFTGGGYMNEGNPAGQNMGMAYHARTGNVFVYAHYRLGPLGFAAHPGFDANGNGNLGLADGIEALKWVSENIAYFGGDSSRVSIRGASAGGAYVSLILASPRSQGLINNVFSMSPYTNYEDAFFSQTAAFEVTMLYVHMFGCSSFDTFAPPAVGSTVAADQAACLTSGDWFQSGRTDGSTMNDAALMIWNQTTTGYDAAATIAAFDSFYGVTNLWGQQVGYMPITTYPNVDGYILDLPPLASFTRGGNKDVTVVYGTTANEYSMLFSQPGGISATSLANHQYVLGLSKLSVTAGLADVWTASQAAPTVTQIAAAIYSDFSAVPQANGDTENWATHIQMANDVWFGRTIDKGSKALIAGGSTKVYKMFYMFGTPATVSAMLTGAGFEHLLGAYHAGEDSSDMGFYAFGIDWIGMSFGLYGYGAMPWQPNELTMAGAIMHYWKNIMATGNPNSAGSGYPVWTANSEMTMGFSPSFAAGAAFGACIRIHPCVSESLATFRKFHLDYYDAYTAGTTMVTGTAPTCAAPWVGAGATQTTISDAFGFTLPYPMGVNYTCSTCTCTGRRDRKTLFGAGSVPSRICSCA
jgi:carboxylesterase type B